MRERVELQAWMIVVACVAGGAKPHRCLLRGWDPCIRAALYGAESMHVCDDRA